MLYEASSWDEIHIWWYQDLSNFLAVNQDLGQGFKHFSSSVEEFKAQKSYITNFRQRYQHIQNQVTQKTWAGHGVRSQNIKADGLVLIRE